MKRIGYTTWEAWFWLPSWLNDNGKMMYHVDGKKTRDDAIESVKNFKAYKKRHTSKPPQIYVRAVVHFPEKAERVK